MPKGNKKIAKTATEVLKILWEGGFFKERKKYKQIEEHLAKMPNGGYHFLSAELATALKRAKYLTRRGGMGNYEYIQKHPFINDVKGKKIKL